MTSSPALTAFERLADTLHGTCAMADGAPSLRFRWLGHELHLSVVHDQAGARTGMVLKLAADPPLDLEVYPQRTLFNLARHVLPLQDIVLGDEVFDRAFVVKGSDPERVKELFAPPERAALLALASLGEGGHATIFSTLKAVVVLVEGRVEALAALEALATHARTLLGAYLRVARLPMDAR
jgi:hypothetical protein